MACFSTEVADSDTWLHLETGKYLVEHHQIPIPDPFSFTTYLGKPLPGEETVRAFNLTHEWLAQTIMYLAYAAGGFGGMVLLRAFLMTAFCALVGLWAYRRSQSFYRALAAAFVTAFIASYFSSDRPYQITYVLIVATILILEYRRWMWLLPPLFLFWANCHGGFFMGFVVLGAYCAESLWQRLRGKPEAGERRLWLVTAVCVPAAFLNPNGFLTLYILLAYNQSSLTSTHVRMAKAAVVAAFVSQSAAAGRAGGAGVAEAQDAPGGLGAAGPLRSGLPLRRTQFQPARTGGARDDRRVTCPGSASLPAWTEWAAARASGGGDRRPLRPRARLSNALCRVEISRRRSRFSAGAPHHAAHVPHLRQGRLPGVALLARRALLHRWTQPE